ncbi:hypothetical protein PFICI_06855 [Pestalotiopsis fici W106-1]|uniref:Clr5 domain-containing protein n=1 Tax=Pestalotiopsis fici (strain W106-1 / CGMCC3.15140) TaxID=1229662 RepID=W3X6W0_PESFW|nr:uncharacterized protein PFICI_06855 [Pestalotiopsis fici W106-1]ETS81853.1 hypothetical protein PFICI_06855 [Pestalotiopsis fici W106-1]
MSKKWEPHKEEILRLYIVENLRLDKVMDHMLETHKFDQKKSQYEYRLKLWGARKNVKKEVLEYLTHQDRKKRKLQGHNSGAYVVDGILLSEARFNRARQRHDPGLSLARKYGRAPSPRLPPGHIVRRASPGAPEVVTDWPQSLPWIQFERRFNIVVPQSSRFMQILAKAVLGCGLIPGIEFNEPSDLARAIYAASYESPSNAANLARILPSIPSDSQSSMACIGLSEPTNVATKILKAFLFQVSNKLYNLEGAVYDTHHDRGSHLLLLFLELNNAYPVFLGQLIVSTDPTSEAILESLYEIAVEHGATALVSRLLEAGRDVNTLIPIASYFRGSVYRGRAYCKINEIVKPSTALQFAASTCNLQLAKILIGAGAETNLGTPTPLQCLCLSKKTNHPDVLYFADLLLRNGARVDARAEDSITPLEGAVLSRNISLVRLLLQCGATESLQKPCGYNAIRYSFLGIKEYELLLPHTTDTRVPSSPLQLAILVGDRSITEIFISSVMEQGHRVKSLERAFITACITGDHDLAQIFLGHLDTQLQDNEDLANSAFLASSWDRDCRVSQLLMKHEAVRNQLHSSRFPIFHAAAFHGNTRLIMLLKDSGFDINRGFSLIHGMGIRQKGWCSISSTALCWATRMGHKDAISIMLDLGADAAGTDLVSAIETKSDRLITQVLNRCKNVDELCDVQRGLNTYSCSQQRALDVAIRYRHGLRLIQKLVNHGAVIRGHEIIDAVRSDDQEVVNFLLPGCDVVGTNPRGETVLEAACCTGNLGIVQFYFSHGGVYGSNALFLAVNRAVEMHDYRVIEHVISNRHPGPIDEYEASALALSLRMGGQTLINMLLDDAFRASTALSIYLIYSTVARKTIECIIGPDDYNDPSIGIGQHFQVDPMRDQLSPLLVAAFMEQEESVRTMLDRGYLPDPFLVELLFDSSSSLREDIRNKIMSAHVLQISHVSDQEWHQRMLLPALSHCADLGIVKQHLARLESLDFEVRGRSKALSFSPLDVAARTGNADYVRTVLEEGATADSRKWFQAAEAVYTAVEFGNLDILSLLMEYGADINHQPHEVFSCAMLNGNFKNMVFLLDSGLDINAHIQVLRDEFTCLELAAEDGMIDAVELLLLRGVVIQGRARIHYIRSVVLAMEKCHYSTAKLLKERGGWNEKDEEIARTRRGTNDLDWFMDDDSSFEEWFGCPLETDTSSLISGSPEGNTSTTSSSRTFEAADEQLAAYEMDPRTDDLSVLDIDADLMDYEQTAEVLEWPFVSYNQQDVELDMIVEKLLLEDGVIF